MAASSLADASCSHRAARAKLSQGHFPFPPIRRNCRFPGPNRHGMQKRLHICAGNVDYRIAFGGAVRGLRKAAPKEADQESKCPLKILLTCGRQRPPPGKERRKSLLFFGLLGGLRGARQAEGMRRFRRPVMVGMRTIVWLQKPGSSRRRNSRGGNH